MFKIFTRATGLVFSRNSRFLGRSADRNSLQITEPSRNLNVTYPRTFQTTASKMAGASGENQPKFTNRLAQEKSPYLLQHAHNPVDWYPWGEEAIQKARDENKLIFLSVGYSTCHWCHVMEHESFENEEIAKVMNENFINIKVDREERPDIDRIYMNFVLMINGSGGWPMSVWLTPELAPITAGTYFPPTDRWGMPGFRTVLLKIARQWSEKQAELSATGVRIIQAIRESVSQKSKNTNPDSVEGKLNECIKIFKRNFDQEYGGFGSAPKFPEVSKLNFLFHAYVVKKDLDVLDISLRTLQKIAHGGIHDHIFGGFARYSVDRKWHVPHFEKMLYDQGQLMSAYANAYKTTGDKFYLKVADGIFRYIMKDLRHPLGGFYSGEDADSLPTAEETAKIEGAFYAWTHDEIRDEIYANEDKFEFDADRTFDIYCFHYDVRENGNVERSSDPHGHLKQKNILIVRTSEDATCEKFNIDREQLQTLLATANGILHEIRDKRPRPHLDTKILTAWNGLILSGLAKLVNSNSEKSEEYCKAARDLIEFIKKFSFDAEKNTLLRSCYGQGTGSSVAEVLSEPVAGFLDDYAFLIKGLLDFYKATLDTEILMWAKELQETQDKLFWDAKHGGYYYSMANSPNVVVRLKEDHDGAEPCGNSVAARNLLLLSVYFEDHDYKSRAQKLLEFFATTSPFGYVLPEMMSALLLIDRGLEMMAVVGPECPETQAFIDIGRKYFIPGMVIVHFSTDKPDMVKRKTHEKFKMINDKPTVYICHNKACQLPITNPQKLDDSFKSNYVIN